MNPLQTTNQMKKITFILLLILTFNACRPTVEEEIGYILEVFAGDVTNFGVEGATVTLFTSQEDFAQNVNAVAKATTNSKGIALFRNLDPKTFFYVISVELGEQNNWEEEKTKYFTRLEEQEQTYKTKIKGSIANMIAGRAGKRWKQTSLMRNNSPDPSCFSRMEQVFRRDWLVGVYWGAGCPDAGNQVGTDAWAITSDNRGMIRGVPGGISQRRLTILELTSTRMVYSETPTAGFTITETFVAVD
jgi:hypothetical protein